MEEAQWFLSGLQKDLRHYVVPYHLPLHGSRVRRKWSHLMRISILRGVRIGRIPLRDIGPADTNALGLFKYVYDDQYRRRRPFVFQPVSDILSRGP